VEIAAKSEDTVVILVALATVGGLALQDATAALLNRLMIE